MTALPTNPSLLEAALSHAGRGWHVFPLRRGTKGRDATGASTHLLSEGHNGASSDPEVVRTWWTRWPDANIGLHLAASGLVVVDADTYKPGCEWQAFIRGRDLPSTLVQDSARGGKHYIFRAPPGVSYPGTLCPGVDIKHKGYILLEPSTFEGGMYRFETQHAPADGPEWLPTKTDHGAGPALGRGTVASILTPGIDVSDRASTAEVEDLLTWIDPDADGYDAWIEVLQALHDNFDGRDEGLAIAEAWSSRGASFRPGETAAKWQGFTSGGGVTVRSIAHRAGQNGADLAGIARRHGAGQPSRAPQCGVAEDPPDLSHDHLALDLGRRSWDNNARHVAPWGTWLFWTGTCWQRDGTLDHLSRTRAFLRMRASELGDWAHRRARVSGGHGHDREARKLETWAREQARTLRSSATIAAVSSLARANPASAATHEMFDADRYLIGTPGGTVDLRTGALRPACREDMISRLTTCAPADPGVSPGLWLRFLSDVFDGDKATIGFLQRAAGYALTGSTEEHKLLFLHGSGRNGKSVFLNTLLDIWGAYGRRVAATTFLNAQTERHPTDIAGLHGARLAIASELPRGKTWDEATIKDLTGGDRMTARFMRQDFFDFDPQMTLMIAGNTQPSFRGVDEAIRSRVVLVPFAVTIPAERRDRGLPDKLRAESPAILRWCIDGALAWQEGGLDVPPSIAAASTAYFDEEDTLGQFLQDETQPDPHAFVAAEDLVLRFNQWIDAQGLGAWTQRSLIKEMRQRGFADARSSSQRGLRGLRLKRW
ncbi:phage/plasmid primase, P4 family [Meridianimarinicoccus sp. MJW13]|uniref:phage/plasmid primase, P4 family n=1 Tax=Meridianimarinicoccus sp. MJW13 TaxID=2720031 RepID=UPI0018671CCB|nr:phage/plasmid primase, P4 family [Fluviibacterium sp. MJW13]